MLCDLTVHHFAIMRQLHVAFHPGFNLLTGETGAGKSILVGALNLILGGRASQELIQTGASETTLEALFDVRDQLSTQALLQQWDLAAGEELVIRRTISRSGRNRALMNGQIVSVQQLQQLAGHLVSISGQHEHQRLLDPAVQLELLDAAEDLEAQRLEVGSLYQLYANIAERLQSLRKSHAERASHLELMEFQLNELLAAQLQPDEDDELERELNLLKHAATLSESAHLAHDLLYAKRGAVLEELAKIQGHLDTLGRIDAEQQSLMQQLEQARLHLQEVAHGLQQYTRQIQFDPHRMAAVEERLAAIHRLTRKYGGRVTDLRERTSQMQTEVARGGSYSEELEKLDSELEETRQNYLEKAKELSRKRRAVAARLCKNIQENLASLDMSRARFAVSFEPEGDLEELSELPMTATGIDQVEFLLSANPGEDLKPLSKVASGGELSRILLALKSLLSIKGQVETLVFDEVDAGIGGRTAELVGLQLQRLAKRHQVICITHLPQIASYAEHHYQVSKDTDGTDTVTRIARLTAEERIAELARMLGGISISAKTLAHAREMLERASRRSG